MVFIKDIDNLSTLVRGLDISNIITGGATNDIPIYDIGASFFLAVPTFIHSEPLF